MLLLSADCVFIILHLSFHFTTVVSYQHFDLGKERGYAEVYQYIKEFWIVLLFLGYFLRTKSKTALAWSALFGYLLLDDSFALHERSGTMISSSFIFERGLGLRAQDFGELFLPITLAILFLLFFNYFYMRSNKAEKSNSIVLLKLMLCLFAFGVGADLLHSLFIESGFLGHFFAVLDDGGEMIVMSFITWFVFKMHDDEPQHTLEHKKNE